MKGAHRQVLTRQAIVRSLFDLAGCQGTCGSMREGGMTDMTHLTRTSSLDFDHRNEVSLARTFRSGYWELD